MAIIGKSLILVQHFWRETCLPQMRIQWVPLILVRASRDLAALLPSAATPSPDSVTAGSHGFRSSFVVSGTVSALLRRSEPSITRCHQILTGTSLCIPTRAASARGQGDLNGR